MSSVPLDHIYYRPAVFNDFDWLAAGESTRHGGISKAPFSFLNLGLYSDDLPDSVRENRKRFFDAFGAGESSVAGAYQVHGDAVLLVKKPGQYKGYDALITRQRGLFLTVTVADCTPILLADPVQRAVAAIHAGWKGTAAGITGKAVAAMVREFGTRPANCYAYVGTCIGASNYEVDADVADHFPDDFKRWDDARGKFFLDLKAANQAQLTGAGIPESQIGISPFCTYENNDTFFSHRKEKGRTGRMLALIGIRE